MSAGIAGRHVVGFGDLSTDVFLEVQKKRCSEMLYLIDCIAYGLYLCDQIKYSRQSAENLFPNILAQAAVFMIDLQVGQVLALGSNPKEQLSLLAGEEVQTGR